MSQLPEVQGSAALGPQSLSVATGRGLAESPPELLFLVVSILSSSLIKSRIWEIFHVMAIVPPNRESQAAYEHPLQRQLDNPA